jgi:hypothetical protein
MTPARSAVFQICLVLFLISTTALAQNTIRVPADQPTIQAAINAAATGDTVLVAPGIYVEHINFNGKAITLTSSDGAASTIIDGGGVGTVVTFNQNETAGASLNGFTIRNGHAIFGAGINITAASPAITNNMITGNSGIDGIGIYLRDSSSLIQGNTVTGNLENMGSGGGGGGGIHITGSSGVTSNAIVSGNVVTNNHVNNGGAGGGILVDFYASALIQNNYIAGNSAYNGGGGISAQSNVAVIIAGNVITNNSSGSGGDGGGLYDQNSGLLLLLNNTLYGDISTYYGTSEIATSQFYTLNSTFKNNIVYATSGTAIACLAMNGALTATNNIVYSVSPGTNGNCPAFVDSNGNIVAEPDMLNPSGGEFHLRDSSPAIDAGATDTNLPSTDQSGAARVLDGNNDGTAVVDIGAFEFVPGRPPAGYAALAPLGATFPITAVGSSAGPINFTLLNNGNAALTVSSIAANSAFRQTNNCPAVLPVKATCLVQVTFTPTADGNFSGTLSIATDAANGTITALLSGVGIIAPSVTLGVTNIDFGSEYVGNATSRIVSITNTGASPLTITNITIGRPFSISGNCLAPLQPNSSCTISVNFAPTQTGTFNDVVRLYDNAIDSPQTVTVTGTGVTPPPLISYSPGSLNFPSQPVGTSSGPQTVTLTNNLSPSLKIVSISAFTPFTQTNTCPTSLPLAASCTITISYSPTARGTDSSRILVQYNAGGGIDFSYIPVSGTGIASGIGISPAALSFGSVDVGASTSGTLTLSNTGDAALSIYAIQSTSSNFVQTNDCGSTVAPGASCSINVTFTPSAVQQYSGTLIITSNANTGHDTQYVSLSGTGRIVAISISPSSIDFGQQLVGVTSTPQMVFISNTGSIDVDINTISLVGADFQQTNTCPAKLAPIQGCTFNITFTPSSLGTRNGSLTIMHTAPGSPAIISLFGTGLAPVASLSTTALTFTTQRVGTASPSQIVTLSNTGNAALTISSIAIVGTSAFVQSQNCPSMLGAGSSCAITVRFRPLQTGTFSGTLVVTDDSDRVSGNTQSVLLTGTGGASTATVSPASLTFAATKVGTSTAPVAVTITNSGTMSLNFTSVGITGDFSQSNNCGSSVAPGASCIVSVLFTPIATGSRTGTLTIDSDAQNGAVQTVSLSGTGAAPLASITPGTLTFATIPVGTQTNGIPVTLTNVGDATMDITSIATTGDFLQSNNCSTMLPIGSGCVIYVWFVPTAAGTRTGLLTITDDAPTSPQTVSLSGSATDFNVTVSPLTVSINPNQNASYNVTVSAVNGVYNQSIPLICSGLPPGATCTINPTSLNPGSTSQTARLKIVTSNGGAPQGTYTIVVTGTAGSVVHSGTATLIVK